MFDGYTSSSSSTKVAEQQRRYRLSKSADIHFNQETVITVKQEDFLSNVYNKSRLINMLKVTLQAHGVRTLQAQNDADVLIVDTAVELSHTTAVAVIGEDVDLIVLLMAKTPGDQDIIFVKPGRGNIKPSLFSTQELQTQGLRDILFLHAFTGCDTTSAAFRKSKLGFIKLYLKSPDVQGAAAVFSAPSSTKDDIEEAGKKCILRWYGPHLKRNL